MEKDYKSDDRIHKASANDAVSKPENEISAEIVSLEIVGEDKPRKHSKKFETWGVITCLSLVAFVICLVYFAFYDLSVNSVLVFCVSSVLLFFSANRMIFISSEELTDTIDED